MSLADAGKVDWFKANRSHVAGELIQTNKNAFILLYVIAARARWRDGFNVHGLTQGEAFIGDHDAYGMTAREYRTAKALLAKHGFATFKGTSKGTVATLANSTVFDIRQSRDDGQKDTQATDARQVGDEQATTNKKEEKERPLNTSERKPKAPTLTARIERL